MKKSISMLLALVLAAAIILPVLPAHASGSGWYVVESTSPYGYCYLYSKPSDIDGRNLGRYNNGSLVYVMNYYGGQQGKYNYCYVQTEDGKYGYMHDYSLTPYNDTATDFLTCTGDIYVVYSTEPYGYCDLYSEPSDITGQNLGRYDNYRVVKMLDYYGGQQGKFNYCKVITPENKVGYMHDYSLVHIDDMVFNYYSCDAPVYYVYSTDPYGYCYLYSEPSDITGRNLGRYNNYDKVKVIEYYGGQEGKFNYCLVITQKNKIGFIHDYALRLY